MTSPPAGEDSPVQDGDLLEAALIAQEFFSQVGWPPDALPVPLDEFLVPGVSRYVGRYFPPAKTIALRRENWRQRGADGATGVFPERCLVLTHSELKWCHTRFTVAVELGNIFFSPKVEYQTGDVAALFRDVLFRRPAMKGTPLWAESMARMIAVELLMPISHRDKMASLLESGKGSLDVATAFRVPQKVAENAMAGLWKRRLEVWASLLGGSPWPTPRV